MLRKLVLILALAAPAAAQAAPLSAECLWQALPPATRDRMIVSYAEQGSKGPRAVQEANDPTLYDACIGLPPKDKAAAGALGYRMGLLVSLGGVEFSARGYLATKGYDAAALDHGWDQIGPEKRALLRTSGAAIQAQREFDQPATRQALLAAAQGAGFQAGKSDDKLILALLDYYLARAMREAAEAE